MRRMSLTTAAVLLQFTAGCLGLRLTGRDPTQGEREIALAQINAVDELAAIENTRLSQKLYPKQFWTTEVPADLPPLPQCGATWPNSVTHEQRVKRTPGVPRFIGHGAGWTPQTLRAELAGRRVVLLGDSVMRTWYNSLACYLNASGATSFAGWADGGPAAEERSRRLREATGAELQDGGDLPIWDYNSFALPDIGAEIAIYVVKSVQDKALSLRQAIIGYHARVERADAIIVNEGVHYHDNATLEHNLESLMQACDREHANCAFRETLPQHFNSPSGLWEDRQGPGCFPKSYKEAMEKDFGGRATWRNDVLHAALARHPRIPVINIFDEMLPLSFAHKPNGVDCTHFVPDMEVWEPLHFKLIELLRQDLPRPEPPAHE